MSGITIGFIGGLPRGSSGVFIRGKAREAAESAKLRDIIFKQDLV
jgi:hypothetical protein